MLMLQPLKNYADFQGRARRSEYWLFYLFILIVEVVLISLAGVGGGMSESAPGPLGALAFGLLGVFALGIIVPSLAVSVRRMHDTNRSGWWVLISLVPFIGAIWYLVLMVLDGTAGPNRFGPDPKGRGDTVAEAFA